MKPLFKWSGGKTKEISKILPLMPKEYDSYYEPFIGGGALWFHLIPPKCHINDNYEAVANFYTVLKQDPMKLINHLNTIADNYNLEDKSTKSKTELVAKNYYYSYRDTSYTNSFDKAVQFYITRQLSFSGMLRFNSEGKFNVPYGWYKKLKKINVNANQLSTLVSNTSVTNLDWKSAIATAGSNDFVFLDPPYTRVFTKYHPDGSFGQNEHQELASWFASKKAKAMIVINKDDFTYSLYQPWIVKTYSHGYSIRYRDRVSTTDATTEHFIAINY